MRKAIVASLVVFVVALLPIALEVGYRMVVTHRLAVLDREMAARHAGRVVERTSHGPSISLAVHGVALFRREVYLDVAYRPDADSYHIFRWSPRRLRFEPLSHFGPCCRYTAP